MTTVKIEIIGLSALLKQLQDVGKAGPEVVEDTIAELALLTESIAVQGIRGGAASGRIYEYHFFTDGQGRLRRGKKRDKPHQASAPGQYPASDTGRLMGSVMSDITPTVATVGTNLVYGQYLEFGTSKMAARPWLLPSFDRAKIGVEKRLKAELEAKL